MKKTPLHFDFTISGFFLGLVLFTIIITGSMLLLSNVESITGKSGNHSISGYDYTTYLSQNLSALNRTLDIQQQEGVLDVIGGYFRAGYGALRIALGSIDVFMGLTWQAAQDVPFFAIFANQFILLIVGLILIGIVLAVALKWRV